MELNLDRSSSLPLYRQIVEQVRDQVETARLAPGTRLPTVRALAESLGLTRLTVHSAFNELQALGIVESFVGRGTFVARGVRLSTPEQRPVLERKQRRLGELMLLKERPDLLSFAQAIPASESYPFEEFQKSLEVAARDLDAFGYGPVGGDAALREQVSALLATRGLNLAPDDVLINNGAQQAIYLALRAFTRADEAVLVEEPTYSGVIELAALRGQRLISVPIREGGIDLAALERACETYRPRLLYTVATFHNPTGLSLAESSRARLLALADRYDFLIVEDDAYGWLSYDGPSPRPLKAFDRSGRVIYVASFSKVLMPSLRLGAIVANHALMSQLAAARESCDLASSALMQRALADFLRRGCFAPHLEAALDLYRPRRDCMLAALSRHMPQATFTAPRGGFNTWVSLPANVNERDFFMDAVDHGVGVARGGAFFAETRMSHRPPGLRLCFATQPPDRIEEGVSILGRLLRHYQEGERLAVARASHEALPLV